MLFSAAELKLKNRGQILDLMTYGGFPEPCLLRDENETRRWSREYRTRLVRDDIRDLERVVDLGLMEQLSLRLPGLVGSPLSINALREDLQVSHSTVSHWLEILERLYFIFRLPPFGPPKIRAVKKEAKHYHYDWTLVQDRGARFENMVACHLLKWCHFIEDTQGRDMELRYFRDVDLHEVDFVVLENGKPQLFLECKTGDKDIGKGLAYLHERMPSVKAVQITLDLEGTLAHRSGITVTGAADFLPGLV
ncbi:MAG: DUF4143 domain-containing protein [Chitinispirillaceae bacterium]|nr:DUF4143 domain-containing protein [Chitinispirillaceae bacterium]